MKNRLFTKRGIRLLLTIFLLAISLSSFSQTIIEMKKEGGIYTIPCKVNGLNLRFIFDTGASSVCISLAEATFMMKNDYLHKEDILGSGSSSIADGSIVENTIVNLREVQIGDLKLNNIKAVVMHNMDAPLLLGQSVIQKLGKIQLQNDKLIILEHLNKDISTLDMESTLQKAKDCYKKGLFALSFELYFQIYDFDKSILSSVDIFNFAHASIQTEKYEFTTKFLEDVLSDSIDTGSSKDFFHTILYQMLARAYLYLNQGDKAIQNIEKSIYLSESIQSLRQNLYVNYILYGDVYLYVFLNSKKALDKYEKAFNMYYNERYKNKYENPVKFGIDIRKQKVKDSHISSLCKRISECYLLENNQEQYQLYSGMSEKTKE